MTNGKTVALSIYVDICRQSVYVLFNTLSRFATAVLPRSKCLLISWLQSPSAVVWEPKKRKYVTASTFPPFICHVVMGPDAMILVFWMWLASELASKVSRTGINMLNLVPAGVWILNPMEVAQTCVIFIVFFRSVTLAIHALGLLHGLALTSVHDYWKNLSFDYMDLCRQSDVSAF